MAKAVSKAAPKPPTPEEIDRHIAKLNAEASSTPAKPKATPKPAAKAAPAKPAPVQKFPLCRWGEGRYLSPATEKPCKNPKVPGHELCSDHELKYRAAKKAARGDAPSKPRVAKPKATTDDTLEATLAASIAAKPPRNSGGAVRTSKPPVRPMGSGAVPSRPAPEHAVAIVAAAAE